MRLRIGRAINNSHIENMEPSRMMNAVLVKLYCEDDLDAQIEMFHRHYASYLHRCATSKETPAANSVQSVLSKAMPHNKVLHLYIAAWGDEPSHYVILHKGEDGLFRVRCRRICEIPAGAITKRDGILIRFRHPDPFVAIGTTPVFQRIFAGGQNVLRLDKDIRQDTELRRELSMSVMVAALFTDKLEFSVWMTPGKAVFQLVEPLPENTYIESYIFECVRTRPYARNVSKPRCIIWADCPGYDDYDEKTQHILPQVKDAERLDFGKSVLGKLLEALLKYRLMPYVGVYDASAKRVAVYGLSYDPDKKEPYITCYNKRRTASVSQSLPMVTPVQDTSRFTPNKLLVTVLKHIAFEKGVEMLTENKANLLRWEALRIVLWAFGAGHPNEPQSIVGYAALFADWGCPLNDDEKRKLGIYSALFGGKVEQSPSKES